MSLNPAKVKGCTILVQGGKCLSGNTLEEKTIRTNENPEDFCWFSSVMMSPAIRCRLKLSCQDEVHGGSMCICT